MPYLRGFNIDKCDYGAEYLGFFLLSFPQNERKVYKLSKINIFFSRFEGMRGGKKQIFRTSDTNERAPLLGASAARPGTSGSAGGTFSNQPQAGTSGMR